MESKFSVFDLPGFLEAMDGFPSPVNHGMIMNTWEAKGLWEALCKMGLPVLLVLSVPNLP